MQCYIEPCGVLVPTGTAHSNNEFEFIYIYIYVCLHMHCTRPCTPYASPITSAHCALSFGTLAAEESTTLRNHLLIGMAKGATSAEDSPDDDSNLSRTYTATGYKKFPDDNSDMGRTHTATGHRKHSSSQTTAQREE